MRWWPLSVGLSLAQALSLPCEATLLCADELNHVYVWCAQEKALLKLWAPRYDSLTRIGGGPGAMEGFFEVVSLAPVGNQQLYVLDVGRQALFLLGTNLQVLSKIEFRDLPGEIQAGFPAQLAVTPRGELFILLRETQEIIRLDAFGRLMVRFGGKVAGPAALIQVQAMRATDQYLLVVDRGPRLLIFDEWGMLVEAAPLAIPSESKWLLGPQNCLWQVGDKLYYVPNLLKSSTGQYLDWPHERFPQGAYLTAQGLYFIWERRLYYFPLP